MEIMAIIAIASKGIALISALTEAGQNAVPAIEALQKLFSRDRTKPPTQAELDEVEATLDALLDSFDEDLPPE